MAETNEQTPRVTARSARAVMRDRRSSTLYVRDFAPMIADESASGGGTDSGPTPLEYIVSGLSACINVSTARMAEKIRFAYDGLEVRSEGVIDTRGRMGLAAVPVGFTSVSVSVKIRTAESDERLGKLADLVARYCPVDSMMRASVPDYRVTWERVGAAEPAPEAALQSS